MSKLGKTIGYTLGTAAVLGLTPLLFTCSSYGDLPAPFHGKDGAGREKNGIASLVAGIIAQKMYSQSNFTFEIEKPYFPDATITGSATKNVVQTKTDLTYTSSDFTARTNVSGNLEGVIDKSEFDWSVRQVGENKYEVARFFLKWDNTLDLTVTDGKINGTYGRGGPRFNWDIKGTYDQETGKVECEIDGPMSWGIHLIGTVQKN